MRKNRFYYLVKEYRLVQERLNTLRADYIRIKTSVEIAKDLEADLAKEIKRANNSHDQTGALRWQAIVNDYFSKDKDLSTVEVLQRAEKDLKEKENIIAYYEKKMSTIQTLLGQRDVELLEGYEKKNIMMGTDAYAALHEEDDKKPKQDDGGFCFTKL
jgi:hypothetical protein